MIKYVYLNSRFVKYKDAKIHIDDRGIQFADSVYEVVAIYNKRLVDEKFHLQRLRISLTALDIKYTVNNKQLLNIFLKLVNLNNIINGIIYLQITRGVQQRNHAYKKNLKPTVIIYSMPKSFNIPNKNFKGVEVITQEDSRWSRADIKTTNLLPNILAENLAHKKDRYTAILIKKNKITEGVSSNIWIIKKNIILTHPANNNILSGVTRRTLKLIIKKMGLTLKENSFTKDQLYKADEVFLTSSGSFITPILKIDNKIINNRKIGHITLKLATLYFNSIKNQQI